MSELREEIEAIFEEIDPQDMEAKLLEIGAEKVGDVHYRHTTFDFPDYRLDNTNSWVRVRDDGERVELAFKKRLGVTSNDGSTRDEGMEEVEVTSSSYEDTKLILKKIGMIEKHEAEKKRSKWKRGDIEFDIDTWPGIPPYLEIEASSWEEIETAAKELGLDYESRKVCSSNQIYRSHGIEVNEYQALLFSGLVKKGS